jgi:hypothetical protein
MTGSLLVPIVVPIVASLSSWGQVPRRLDRRREEDSPVGSSRCGHPGCVTPRSADWQMRGNGAAAAARAVRSRA